MSEEEVGGRHSVKTPRLERTDDVSSIEAHIYHDFNSNWVIEVGLGFDVGSQRTVLITCVYPLVLHHRLEEKKQWTLVSIDVKSSFNLEYLG